MKKKIPRIPRQVFDAIGFLTYGANPRVKEAQITGKQIMNLTGLDKVKTSKGLAQLLKMNLVTKNSNYWPPMYRINKDYESWKELPKTVTVPNIKASQKSPKIGVTKKGNRRLPKKVTPKNPTFNNLEEIKNTSDLIYDFYKNEILPLRKSSKRAKENIAHYLKKYSSDDLKKAISNYKTTMPDDPKFRKDPANFFGKVDRYFIDYMPDNFECEKSTEYSTAHFKKAEDFE